MRMDADYDIPAAGETDPEVWIRSIAIACMLSERSSRGMVF
jgi:hypothetical protein